MNRSRRFELTRTSIAVFPINWMNEMRGWEKSQFWLQFRGTMMVMRFLRFCHDFRKFKGRRSWSVHYSKRFYISLRRYRVWYIYVISALFITQWGKWFINSLHKIQTTNDASSLWIVRPFLKQVTIPIRFQ